MDTEIITVKAILQKQGPKSAYHSVETDKGNLNCFDEKTVETLRAWTGSSCRVEIGHSKDGKFKHIVKVLDTNVQDAEEVTSISSVPDSYRQNLIVRQSCLKAAVEFKDECTVEAVLELAEKFEKWVFRE